MLQSRFRILGRSSIKTLYALKKNTFKIDTTNNLIYSSPLCKCCYSTNTTSSEQRRKEFLAIQKLGQLSSKAITHQKLGRFEDAIKVYQEIVEVKPDSFFAILQIGYILAFELNKKTEAIPHLERVIEITKIPETYSNAEEMDDLVLNAVEFQPKARYFLSKLYKEMASETSDSNSRLEMLEQAKYNIETSLELLNEYTDSMEIQPEAIVPFENLREEIVNMIP